MFRVSDKSVKNLLQLWFRILSTLKTDHNRFKKKEQNFWGMVMMMMMMMMMTMMMMMMTMMMMMIMMLIVYITKCPYNPTHSVSTITLVNLFPVFISVGARVFARFTNGLYYRGFLTNATSTTVFISYDDGDVITLKKNDVAAVILDKLPCYHEIYPGLRIIGYWPGRTRYYPGKVTSKKNISSGDCYQKAEYDVLLDDGDRRLEDFHEIRILP